MNWDLRVVNQSYEWVERAIVFKPELKNWQSAVRDRFLEAGIGPTNGFSLDHLVGTKIGGGSTFDSTGRRHCAADLLSYAKTSNIRVAVHAIVDRVLLATSSPYPESKPSVIGVFYRDQRSGFHHAMQRDKGEVLLSAGALGSPQLLLLSGIRPRAYLSSWRIPVARHHP
jgi:mandelonitrile lyase